MIYLKKFNENSDNQYKRVLLFYSFDWDDNILYMPTVIHMDKLIDGEWVPTDVSTAEFAQVRSDKQNWRIINNDPVSAFSEFRDFGPRGEGAFLQDVKKAISLKRFGPSWDDFIECLSSGCLFAIITARGHESKTMRTGIEWIIDNILSENEVFNMYNNILKFTYLYKEQEKFDRILKGKPSESSLVKIYLDNCDFVGVSAPSRGGTPDNPEKAKEEALLSFKERINRLASNVGLKAMIGFSDDDLGNVKHIEDLIDNLNHEQFPNIVKYVVKGTKDPENITKRIRDIEPFTETSHQTPGLESSIMPFTQFNNMTNRLYPKGPENRQDDFQNQSRRQSEFLAKNSKEVLDDDKKKVRIKETHKKKIIKKKKSL
jgi:hypothetical protein